MTSQAEDGPVDVLLVEDNPGDVRLTREALEAGDVENDLHVVRDGEAALDFLERTGEYVDVPAPDLILLDLNLPRVSGMDVLATIKHDEVLKRIPVVMLTGSEAPEDVLQSYEHHSAAYLTKPVDPDEFIDLVQSVETFWTTQVTLPPEPSER